MFRSLQVRSLFVGFALLAGAGAAQAENWPQWRGPHNDGISKETGLPTTWSETKNVAWKLPMPGKAGSTPVIWGDRIFLTSAKDKEFVLLAISTKGTVLWERKLADGGRAYMRDEGNEASASPSTDGKNVITFVGTGDCACHDFEGNQLWHFNAQERYGKYSIQHGVHITPLLEGDRVYMVLLHSNGHWVIALDKATGKEIWKVERKSDAVGESREAYSSPILWNTGKDTELVVLGCDYTTGHRLKDGSEIWRLTDLNGKGKQYSTALRIIASPVASPDLLVVPTARGGLVAAVKPGAEGLVKPGGKSEAWRIPRGAPDVPSPVIADGLVYLCRENGVLHCIDAKTGKQVYEGVMHRDRYRSSPVLADGKLYCTAREGIFTVVKPGTMYERLAENTLPDQFTASPAISGGRIYLRGFKTLYAIQEAAQ